MVFFVNDLMVSYGEMVFKSLEKLILLYRICNDIVFFDDLYN